MMFQVVSHRDYSSREDFDEAISQALVSAGVEIVCLAGFMRILSGKVNILLSSWFEFCTKAQLGKFVTA